MQLRKDGVRKVAKALGLPESTFRRILFLGPALAARVIGEVYTRKDKIVRIATRLRERGISSTKAFQYMAILHQDRCNWYRDGKRDFGLQNLKIRCWDTYKMLGQQALHDCLIRFR